MSNYLEPLLRLTATTLQAHNISAANVVAISSDPEVGQAADHGWYTFQTLAGLESSVALGLALANHHTTGVVVATPTQVTRDIRLLSQLAMVPASIIILCLAEAGAPDGTATAVHGEFDPALWFSLGIPFIARHQIDDQHGIGATIGSALAAPRLALLELKTSVEPASSPSSPPRASSGPSNWRQWQTTIGTSQGILRDELPALDSNFAPASTVALVDQPEPVVDLAKIAARLIKDDQ